MDAQVRSQHVIFLGPSPAVAHGPITPTLARCCCWRHHLRRRRCRLRKQQTSGAQRRRHKLKSGSWCTSVQGSVGSRTLERTAPHAAHMALTSRRGGTPKTCCASCAAPPDRRVHGLQLRSLQRGAFTAGAAQSVRALEATAALDRGPPRKLKAWPSIDSGSLRSTNHPVG